MVQVPSIYASSNASNSSFCDCNFDHSWYPDSGATNHVSISFLSSIWHLNIKGKVGCKWEMAMEWTLLTYVYLPLFLLPILDNLFLIIFSCAKHNQKPFKCLPIC